MAPFPLDFREVEVLSDPEVLHRASCGLHFERGILKSHLPLVPLDVRRIPDPYLSHAIQKPSEMIFSEKPNYSLTLMAVNGEEETVLNHPWMLAPHERQKLRLGCDAMQPVCSVEEIPFEIWTPERLFRSHAFPLSVSIQRDFPTIQFQTRNEFGEWNNTHSFDFGAVSLTKGREMVLSLYNSGLFPAAAHLSIESELENIFSIENTDIVLEPGETKEILIQANPIQEGFILSSLIAQIKGNRNRIVLDLACTGAAERLKIHSIHHEVPSHFLTDREAIAGCTFVGFWKTFDRLKG